MPQSERIAERGCGTLAESIIEMELILRDRRVDEEEVTRLVNVVQTLRLALVLFEGVAALLGVIMYAIRVGPDAILNKPHLRHIRDIAPGWRVIRGGLTAGPARRAAAKARASEGIEVSEALALRKSA